MDRSIMVEEAGAIRRNSQDRRSGCRADLPRSVRAPVAAVSHLMYIFAQFTRSRSRAPMHRWNKCDKIFGKKEDNFHFPIRARYAS